MIWPSAAVADIAESIDYGLTASSTAASVGPKFLRITDIQNGNVNWDEVPFCIATDGPKKQHQLQVGDIVFARTGATTGKSYLIKYCPVDAVFASYLIRVRPNAKVDPVYLSHFFRSSWYWAQVERAARGVAQPGINASVLASLRMPLPPMAEQRRISTILNAADSVRLGFLARASRLTALKTSFFSRAYAKAKDSKTAQELAIGDFCVTGSGTTPSRQKADIYFGGAIPWVKSSELRERPILRTEESISERALRDTALRMLPIDTVLLAMYGATIGRVGILKVPATTNQAICHVIPDLKVAEPSYVYYALQLKSEDLTAKGVGGAQPNINQEIVRQTSMLVPPLTEQRSVLARMDEIDGLYQVSERGVLLAEALVAGLRDEAFLEGS